MIQPLFNTQAIQASIAAHVQRIEAAILAILQRRGEQFIVACRNELTYEDQTGNLRSSIGYFIYKGNTCIMKGFGDVEIEGQDAGTSVAEELTKEEGVYYLIGVAGMNYASAVESLGYNVISNQKLMIIPLIEGDFDNLRRKLAA